jgi:diguanylate cyclase (GGDEF)-like protein
LAQATARDVERDESSGDVPALEQEVVALRQELRLLKLANEELERLVVRDTLTPLYNRRHFITCLTERLNRLDRYGTTCALLFIDVNGMKSINDTYGHSAGDVALNHVAQLLLNATRSTDIAARVGGDEFALLLDGLDEAAAHDKTVYLGGIISSSECFFEGKRLPLSASFGCTGLRPGDSDFAAIARADMAMYAAKRQNAG